MRHTPFLVLPDLYCLLNGDCMCDQQSKAKGMVCVINLKSIVQDLGHDCSCNWSSRGTSLWPA